MGGKAQSECSKQAASSVQFRLLDKQQYGDGKYIKLEDGSLWGVDIVDTVDSSLWLELDEVTAHDGKLINTDEKESVEARRTNQFWSCHFLSVG